MKRLLLLLLLACAAFAADKEFWSSKPYQNWSAKECEKMLHDSPWATSLTLRTPTMRQLNRSFGKASRDDNGTGERDPETVYTAQIRSALPLRQAYARLKQIQSHYDSLAGDAKTKAQDAYAQYLSATFDDKIVVVVDYESNLPDTDRALATYWQGQTLGTLHQSVFLSGPDGDRVEPIAFVAGRGAEREFQFVFPRNPAAAQANPDRPLEFEFRNAPNVATPIGSAAGVTGGPGAGSRMYFKFQTKQMLVAGKIVY